MLYCERGTSVFFPPIDKVVQVYSCRVVEFFSFSGANNKRLQKSIHCKDDCVGPPIKKLESVCIETNLVKSPNTSYSSESEKTKKEKMYGSDDTAINWEPPQAKLKNRGKQTGYEVQDTKKKYRRRRKSSRVSKGIQSCKNPTCFKSIRTEQMQRTEFPPKPSKLVNTKQVTFDKKSLVSIFRKKRKKYKNPECKCPFEVDTSTLAGQNKKHKNTKTNIKFEMKPKNYNKDQIYEGKEDMFRNLLDGKKCYEGICSKASKRKAKNFVCTCVHKKEPGVICSDDTCAMVNISSFSKLKNRAWYLCRKSLQKLGISRINDTNKICDEGSCKEAFRRENPNISCICKEKIKKCSDETCVPKKKALTKNQKRKENIVVRNEIEQTGDPLFEIKVNTVDMCVLNPSEIKDKIRTLGDINKRECVCPSHVTRNQIRKREVFLRQPRQIVMKNKKTDFSCKCLKNKKQTCTDSTCNKVVTFSDYRNTGISGDGNGDFSVERNVTNTGTNKLNDKPLFEVKLDNDNMCIINTNEMQQKFNNIHRRKMIRNGFDTAAIKGMKSKISVFCHRMRSDNLINGNKKNKLRTRKTLIGMLRTQSENVHKRDGLKIHIKNKSKWSPFVADANTTQNVKKYNEEIKNTTLKKDLNKIPFFPLLSESRNHIKNIIKANTDKLFKSNSEKSPITTTEQPTAIKKSVNSSTAKPTRINEKKSKEEKKTQKTNRVITPAPSPKVSKKPVKTSAECFCRHTCGCHEDMDKRRLKAKRDKKLNKLKHKGSKRKKQLQKNTQEHQKYAAETKVKRKQLLKEKKELLKEEAKRRKLQKKEDREVIKLLESEEGASKNNCIVEILAAIVSLGFAAVKVVLFALLNSIFKPINTLTYVRQRWEDPTGTWLKIKKEVRRGWTLRKLKVCKCFKNSEKANIIADAFKESAVYNTFVDKGKTKKEQVAFESEVRARQKRVKQRREAALYGCRHVLLTTLRKTPCLWVYHVCPNFYPQCLSLITVFNQLGNICLFVLALACWTPCIVLCELTRALFCCILCTG